MAQSSKVEGKAITDFTREAQALVDTLKEKKHYPLPINNEDIAIIATALAAAYERGKMEEREQNKRILADPCVQKLRPDEPFFVLLGRDPDAKRALGEWLSSRENREGLSDKTHAAETTLFAFIDYQRNQP